MLGTTLLRGTFPNGGPCGRSRPYVTRIGTEVLASRPAGKRRGGEAELKRPNATLRKLPAGTCPVPANAPDQLAPGAPASAAAEGRRRWQLAAQSFGPTPPAGTPAALGPSARQR